MAKQKVNFTMSPVKKSKSITEEIELSKTCKEKRVKLNMIQERVNLRPTRNLCLDETVH